MKGTHNMGGTNKDSHKEPGRLLGVDYGEKRVGIALSDESQTIAMPLAILPNDRTLFREFKSIVQARNVRAVVMGDSKDFRGNDNPIMKMARAFKAEIERDLQLDVFLEPEFLTTHQAHRQVRDYGDKAGGGSTFGGGGSGETSAGAFVDASAAAIILQSYLDRAKNAGRTSTKNDI